MKLKNRRSSIEAYVSMGKIENLLIEIGATNINKSYKDKVCTGITFLYFDERLLQTFCFQLKAQVDACFIVLMKQFSKPIEGTKERVMQQANQTAWNILSDWTEIQCSMITLGQAEPLQMFLPFVYDTEENETLYAKISNKKINLLPQLSQ